MIREALDEYVRSVEKKYDRSQTVGASEVGLCARRVCFAKKGHIPVEGSWGAWMRGTTMEEAFWQPALKRKFGKKLLYSGPDQKSIAKGKLSATPDGVLVDQPRNLLSHLGVRDIGPDGSIMVECKTIDPRIDLKAAKEENVFQVQCQMGLVRDLTKHRPNYALVTYTDASFWDDVDEFAIRFDPKVYKAGQVRANLIMGADPLDLKPEGWIAGGKECEYCPFAAPCGVERRRLPPEEGRVVIPDQFRAEVIDLCADFNAARDEVDAATAKQRDVAIQIKDRLRAHGIRKIHGVVSWSETAGRKSYEIDKLSQAMAAKGLNIADFEKYGDESDRLTVSR